MKYALYYWLFEPLRGGLIDNPSRVPCFCARVTHDDVEYELAVLADTHGTPEAARIRIPGLADERITDNLLPILQILKEHLLSTLRLVYREDIQFFPMATWSFFDEGSPHSVNLQIDLGQATVLDGELARNFFLASLTHRNEVRLLVDGNDPRIPSQYRYLSFYKFLEHEFKAKGQWQVKRFGEFLDSYAERFKVLGYTERFASSLHDVRDRCAHIRTGNTKETLGVTSLNHKQLVRVNNLLPLMTDLCRDILNQKASGQFQLGDIRPWYERIERQSGIEPN